MRPRSVLSIAVILLTFAAAGCGRDSGADNPDAAIRAVATTTQVADFVRRVGGQRVALGQILEPNSEPHDYEPRPSDAREVAEAELIFRSGGEVDGWLDDLIENAGGDAEVVDLIESVEAGGDDPHWWQNPRNAVAAAESVRDRLIAADPAGRAAYERNAAAYVNELKRLDRKVAACIAEIPARQRRLVTTHDALGPYADRYGLEVIGALIPSLSTQAQPSAGDTQDLVEQIERLGVRAIFPESSVSPKLEEAVARETGADVGVALWADTLGPEGSDGATYVDSIVANTEAIVSGLTGGEASCRPG